MQSLWSALDKEVIGAEAAREIAQKHHARVIERARRWIAHIDNRLAYERVMLGQAGGLAADRFNIKKGGRVLIGGEWLVVLRVNKINGRTISLTTTARFVPVRGIEEIVDYRPPAEGDVEKVIRATKLPPMTNFPGEGVIEMTSAEWNARPKDYKCTRTAKADEAHGAYRYRQAFAPGGSYRAARVYLTDAKRVDPPPPDGDPQPPVRFEREIVAPAVPLVQASAPKEPP